MYCVEIYVIIKKGLKFQYAGSHALLVFRVFLVMSYKFLKLFFFCILLPRAPMFSLKFITFVGKLVETLGRKLVCSCFLNFIFLCTGCPCSC